MPHHVRSITVRTLLVTFAVLAPTVLVACSRDDGPRPTLQAFFDGWAGGDLNAVELEGPDGALLPPAAVLDQIDALSGDLNPRSFRAPTFSEPAESDGRASSTVNAEWTIADGLVWSYQTTVNLREVDGKWRVVFTPTTVHPTLVAGDTLVATPIAATRGSIVDGADQPIVTDRPVVVVGLVPQNIDDLDFHLTTLDAAFTSLGLDVPLTDLPQQIAAANPDAFVEVVTLRREAYDQIRPQIHPLPGTVFREETRPLAPSREFARALLGTVGEATREQLDANPGRYLVGEQIGQSGLQAQFNDLLGGTPGVEIRYRRGDAVSDAVLFRAEPVGGEALRTTLDQGVQAAADAALVEQAHPSALVAVRVSDGAILAVANGPGGGELNLALNASVPPGSTFKMVSALGLLSSGEMTGDTPVECPQAFTVEGRTFTNAGGFELGTVPFHTAFARSCNTAFASLAPQLGGDGLRRAAASVGVGTTWNLGTPVAPGSVGVNQSGVESAAAAFGQGTTLVSPVVLGGAAAAVARGTWIAPKLFPQLPPGASAASTGESGNPPADGTALPTAAVTALQAMMREVVTAGTATSLADVPGAPVHVKTGTAEFNDNPADTHAWTIGWQGDIAFAVFVENGGDSGPTAVPIVEAFLRGLA